ncbi:hypothetical protein [Polluticoccus soli]|uniref:hypothetical protein n=1 Tax=Polluticoccus soli TaxID=3034150 RepID=UPI0023E224C6|nr:hypothetical protein [Flavipsychrobacter sp. JY13-12]
MKKLLVASVIIAGSLTATAKGAKETNKVTLIVSLTIDNFAEWKKAFDAGASVREQAGIKVLQICSLAENEKHVIVIEEAESLQAAQEFVEVLKKRQKPGTANVEAKLYQQHGK